MADTRPEEFQKFAELLMENAPDGYRPWFFRCNEASKAPDTSFGSWKQENARLSVSQAVKWMERGNNVGIAGRANDRLVNVDIDDEDETTPDDLKPTLIARSRSRTGAHGWYFESDHGEDIPNIPTDDKGEVRADWQYVVAPGSYVPVDDESALPPDERADAGYYTVEREHPVASLRYEELPDVFIRANKSTDDVEVDTDGVAGGSVNTDESTADTSVADFSSNSNTDNSALFGIEATDVVRKENGSTKPSERWSGIFHDSDTGENMSVSGEGLLHCWRHNVAHNGLQALAVLSGYSGSCEAVGSPHKGSNAGTSCLQQEDGAHVWHAWKYAKQNNYIPDDDPVPYAAIKHICRVRDFCPITQLPDGPDGSIDDYAWNAAIESIEGHDGLNPGRKRTDEFDDDGDDSTALDVVSGDQSDSEQGDNSSDVHPVEPEQPPEADMTTAGGTNSESDPKPRPDADVEFAAQVQAAIVAFDNEEITRATARDRIAEQFTTCYDFLLPEEDVRGWRTTLYVYHPPSGIYEPRGERFIQRKLERTAGDFVSNQTVNEIVGKVERRSIERGDDFDAPPQQIVVANGVLNLHTGECKPHTPTEYHRTCIDVAWNPDAGAPDAIDAFLHEVVADDDVATLYRLIAHTLYKEYIAEKAAILIGSGKNGKSVFIDFVEKFIGRQNVAHRELQDFDDDGFAANNLQGKLANLATEIGEQELKSTTTFKKLTGRDTMDARVKYESPVTFENHATMMFSTNNMPVFGQDNFAIWRRWVYLDFPYSFKANDPSAKDPEPKSKVLDRLTSDAQLEALLLKCQQEIQRWHETGAEFFADAMDPSAVRDKMKKAAEPVYNFASTCLTAGDPEDTFVEKSIVRAAYRAYADVEDLPTVRENVFGERLVALRDYSIEPERKRVDGAQGRTQVYTGVELSQRGRQVLGLDTPAADADQSQVDATPSETDAETDADTSGRTDGDPHDEPAQKTELVLQELEEMVANKGGDPVPRNSLEWRAAKAVGGKVTAENAVDTLLETGRIVENDADVFPADF